MKPLSVEANSGCFWVMSVHAACYGSLEDANELLNPLQEELQKRLWLCIAFLQLENGSVNGINVLGSLKGTMCLVRPP